MLCFYSSGLIQGSLSKIQVLLKTIFQFSRIKSFEKILIKELKFFQNAEELALENEYEIDVPLFGAAFAAPNKGTKILY